MTKYSLAKKLLIICTIFPISGCFPILKYSIKEDHKLWGGYKPQSNYILVRDVFLTRPDGSTIFYKDTGKEIIKGKTDRLALAPERSFYRVGGLYAAPYTIADFEKNPDEAIKKDYDTFITTIDVVGIVRSGTIIRTEKIERVFGASWWWRIYAVIKTGPFAGKEVDIQDLSESTEERYKDYLLGKPDERLLKLMPE
jgi:hypothetical protein